MVHKTGELEKWAMEIGFSKTILVTGVYQPEAIRFYQKMDYQETEKYGNFVDDDLTVCMEKDLIISNT